MFVLSSRRQTHRRRTNGSAPVNVTLNGLLQGLANSVLQPIVFLSAIASLLGGSNYQVVGFVVATGAAWALAPFLSDILFSIVGKPYPIVIGAGAVRILAVILIMLLAIRLDLDDGGAWVRRLFLAYLIYQIATAVAAGASTHTIASAIRGHVKVPVFRARAIASLVGGMIASLIVWSVVRNAEITRAFAIEILLLFAGTTVLSASWFLFAIPNGIRSLSPGQRSGVHFFSHFRSLVSRRMRRYLTFRIALGFGAAADAFVIIFGIQELSLSLANVGIALVWLSAGHLAGHLVWSFLDRRNGPRLLLQSSALLRLAFLVLAIGLPSVAGSTIYTDRFPSPHFAQQAFAALFVLTGLGTSALAIGNFRYLFETHSPRQLQDAQGLTNLTGGILAFLPLGAAWIVSKYSIEAALIVSSACTLIALLISGLLTQTHVRMRTRR